jgi:hypothetical protein
LGIKRSRFFLLLKRYKECPGTFSIQYRRKTKTRTIPQVVEDNILKELQAERTMIENPDVPVRHYNYSYIRDLLGAKYAQKVSVSTIIGRAKEHGFYMKKPPKTAHDHEVLTNYVGELIQHDSFHHLFSPPAKETCYLITSLDDFSRFLLYAALVKKETSWSPYPCSPDGGIDLRGTVSLLCGFPLL